MLALAIACALVTALPATGFAAPMANIELSASHPQANKAFDVSGMLPGDAESMDAVIDVSHTDDANVIFTAALDEETQRLSEALQARITDRATGSILYDGSVAELANGTELSIPLSRTAEGRSQISWTIEVSAPSSMTNEYQNARCGLTLDWAVAYEDGPAPQPSQPGKPGGGILDNLPATGDILMIGLIALFCACAVVCMRTAATESDDDVRTLPLPFARAAAPAVRDNECLTREGLGRLAAYIKEHKRMIAAMLSIVFLLLVLGTAWALFWAHATIPNNRFEMGSIAVDLNEGQPILPDEGVHLEPGRTVVEDFTVSNVGSAECYYRLHIANLQGALAPALHVTIVRPADGATLYSGSAIDLERGDLCQSPTPLAPGATDTLTMQVKMSEGSGNESQGTDVTFDVALDAVQARNNTGREF